MSVFHIQGNLSGYSIGMSKRKKVLLIFGGESSEHEISIRSARNVYAAIDKDKYDVELCFIEASGQSWQLVNSLDDLSGKIMSPELGKPEFVIDGVTHRYDVFLPILHGENGHEDGAVQGLAKLMHVPVVGCGIGASAVCWNKLYAKQILEQNGISTAPYVVHRRGEDKKSYEDITGKLGAVLFVKPSSEGSSVGVSKVKDAEQFDAAITNALRYSPEVLIESSIEGQELEVAVLGDTLSGRISGVGEIVPGEEFYSYEDKYADDSKAQVLTRANISDNIAEQARESARAAYVCLGCEGLARVDFMLSKDGKLFLNELNTMPGFTSISQYPKLWEEQGISQPLLIDELITMALGN